MADNTKILLVDDDEFLLDMYALKFKEAGFDIDVATSGEDALNKLQKGSYGIMLLDIVMPILDGFEVLAKIKRDNIASSVPVIVLSNLGQKEDIDRGIALGAKDYVIKAHFTPSEVVEKVKSVLASSH